jgi:2-amino-4-hydroxy-6-hydroxymethyldihydropteridine diphosphokinase
MPLVYIGLGANLGDRKETIRAALDHLAGADISVLRVSALRETDPVGYEEQPRFLNGVAEVETALEPLELLDRLLAVERELGRTREGPRFGPRTIDLDLLLYGDLVLRHPRLTIPHPRLAERGFVLEPLAELDPDLVVPGAGPVRELVAGLHCNSCRTSTSSTSSRPSSSSS